MFECTQYISGVDQESICLRFVDADLQPNDDGATNMARRLQGVQAILRKEQPLATYYHCGPHGFTSCKPLSHQVDRSHPCHPFRSQPIGVSADSP
jgi:hypothetical protein